MRPFHDRLGQQPWGLRPGWPYPSPRQERAPAWPYRLFAWGWPQLPVTGAAAPAGPNLFARWRYL